MKSPEDLDAFVKDPSLKRLAGAAVHALHQANLRRGAAPILIANVRPADPVRAGLGGPGDRRRRIWVFDAMHASEYLSQILELCGERKGIKFNYAVRDDGTFVVGEIDNVLCGHVDLVSTNPVNAASGDKPCLAAGEFKIQGGELCWVNNQSGHYPHTADGAFRAAQIAFKFYFGVADIGGRYFRSAWSDGLKKWVPCEEQLHDGQLKKNGGKLSSTDPSRLENQVRAFMLQPDQLLPQSRFRAPAAAPAAAPNPNMTPPPVLFRK